MPTAAAAPTISPSMRFVGRQPILDVNQRIFGYELLFRSGLENVFSGDPQNSTRQTIDNVLLFGMDTVAPGGKAFINCTHEALADQLVTSLPAGSTVLEVLETVEVDDAVFKACIALAGMGYRIALDDFIPGSSSERLLKIADYVKIDLRASSPAEIQLIQRHLKGFKGDLIAEKVETQEEFLHAREQGFRYFQGYFFSHPAILQIRDLPPNQMVYIQLLCALSHTPCDQREIERLVSTEASLCYRILRMVNSPNLPIRSHITSIRQALLMVGLDEFRKLVTVASAATLGKQFNLTPELILLALHHARFCELLAPAVKQQSGEQYLIGLLSAFDAILQVPMSQILKLLPLRKEAEDVLLGHDSPVATPIRILGLYEQKQWECCAQLCRPFNISESELSSIYVTALQWASTELRNAGL